MQFIKNQLQMKKNYTEQDIKELLRNNKHKEALEILAYRATLAVDENKELINQVAVLVLQTKEDRINHNKIIGTVSHESQNLDLNNLTDEILKLLPKFDDKPLKKSIKDLIQERHRNNINT